MNNTFYSNKALHKMLTDSIIGGHLCHAYLFYGQKSIGKRTLAKNFAMSILCKSPLNKPCGNCVSCHKIISNNHPDLFIYDGKDGKNSIHIETIREIRQDAYIAPNESDYKIYIIPNADDMSIAAANSFLKVLEEPPAHSMFILTAKSKSAVPETILSRCVSFEVFPMTLDEEIEALSELLPDKESGAISDCAVLSNGNMGRAIQLLTESGYAQIADLVQKATASIVNKDEYTLLNTVYKASGSKSQLIEFISELSTIIRFAILHKLSVKLSTNVQVTNLSYHLTMGRLERLIELLALAVQGLDGNVYIGLLVNHLTASIINTIN